MSRNSHARGQLLYLREGRVFRSSRNSTTCSCSHTLTMNRRGRCVWSPLAHRHVCRTSCVDLSLFFFFCPHKMHACTSLVLQASFRSVGCMHTRQRQRGRADTRPRPPRAVWTCTVRGGNGDVGVGKGVRDAHRDQETEAWRNVGAIFRN
jgi:hypothetical protein